MTETVFAHLGGEDAFYKWFGNPAKYHNHIHLDGKPHGTGTPLCMGGSGPPPKGGWAYPPGSPFLVRAKTTIDAMHWPHVFHGSGFVCRDIDCGHPDCPPSQHAMANGLDLQATDWTSRFAILDPLWTWLHRGWPGFMHYVKLAPMHGPDVGQWKRALTAKGYTGMDSTDLFGTGTDKATRAFQTRVGIADDGVVGPITRAAAFPL